MKRKKPTLDRNKPDERGEVFLAPVVSPLFWATVIPDEDGKTAHQFCDESQIIDAATKAPFTRWALFQECEVHNEWKVYRMAVPSLCAGLTDLIIRSELLSSWT